MKSISLKGVRENNLKNFDLEIPLNKLIVITGLSGCGKSSLAFDTLYAEGQRRYVESLSSYARQFLTRMKKPDCDQIIHIPPAIAIDQKKVVKSVRSTVGTTTDVFFYLQILFARIGKTYSPISGELVKRHQPQDAVNCMLTYPEGSRFTILTPIILAEGETIYERLTTLKQEGFNRIEVNAQSILIDEALKDNNLPTDSSLFLIIDRLTVNSTKELQSRLTDSVETAYREGNNDCYLHFKVGEDQFSHHFSSRFEADGMVFQELTDSLFNFNAAGACKTCQGFGVVTGIDERLVIPDHSLSLYDDAVFCWRTPGFKEYKQAFIEGVSTLNFPIFTPYSELTADDKSILWNGTKNVSGINQFIAFLESHRIKPAYGIMLARLRGKTVCPVCKGSRFITEVSYTKISGSSISELAHLPINELATFFKNLVLDRTDTEIAARILIEINNRINYLIGVGLGYLSIDRPSSTLSGGESQRIKLASSLGNNLVGSLYILDEPSVGLHSRDTELLISVLRNLRDLGNTVVVVEHDEDIIRQADHIIDLGPDAGLFGGQIMFQGSIDQLPKNSKSHTANYLLGEQQINIPTMRRPWNYFIDIKGAKGNNLKNINVKIPLNIMTVITGVSGSGKSTLVRDIVFKSINLLYGNEGEVPELCTSIGGDLDKFEHIYFVNQDLLVKSKRSNAVTLLGIYEDIRKLFADQPLAKQMDYTANYFSFNAVGGRCEECKGQGNIPVDMLFIADLNLVCDSCNGKRFKRDVLEITYFGKNIFEILEMSADESIAFFELHNEPKICKKIRKIQDVGLGYIKLGQTFDTLSGGENQRLKLASYLSMERAAPSIFIFDEPTTGLHIHDIKKLLSCFNELIARKHSVIIVEHNMEVIKCADYLIDLGPDGGEKGGQIVAVGTPEEVSTSEKSYTGHYLKIKLNQYLHAPL